MLEDVYEFNDAIEVFTLAEVDSKLVNLVNADAVNVFWFAFEIDAADAELINEPVIVANDVSYAENPVVDCKVIWDEPLTTESPPALKNVDSAPAAPPFQKSY